MQKSLFFKSSKSYLIPILLLVGSFVIYSYNLENQPWHGDEMVYFGWSGVYFDLIKEGDFNNPCLKTLADCELLYSGEYGEVNYVSIRNFFIGFGQYLTTGEMEGHYYNWSCAWMPCFEFDKWPTSEDYYSGRFFSPIFGSLTVVLAFSIGKNLFNRNTGLFFSLTLLFSSLWVIFSRQAMTEVYVQFFIMLSIFLLLKSFKKENNHRVLFFILSAISFGCAVNVKFFALGLILPILLMVLFYDSFNEKLNFRFFQNKKNVLKAISLVLVFFMISSITFVVTYPKYYDDTLSQILKISARSETTGYASFPTAEKNYLFQTLATSQVTLLPYLMDSYIHDVFLDEVEKHYLYRSPTGTPFNYSTIPLSLFFFIGIITMIGKIITRNLKFSEFALLVWFSGIFIFTLLTVDEPTNERYYLTIMFPVTLIASYALGKFIKQIPNQKEKILFFMSFIIAHSLYIFSFFNEIYFTNYSLNSFWKNPLPVSSQLSLIDPLVYVSTIIFIGFFILIYLRVRLGISVETR